MLIKLNEMIEENLYKAAQCLGVNSELHSYYQGKAESIMELKEALTEVDKSMSNLKQVMDN